MSTFKEIDYANMPEDYFRHLYIDSILKQDAVWGCIPEPAFDRACSILIELGFINIEVERIVNDPETVLTYVVSSTRNTKK